MYAVQAMRGGKQVPTFYLYENVQGIRDNRHACQVALEVLGWVDPGSLECSYLGKQEERN